MKPQKRDLPSNAQLGFALLADHFAHMRGELGLSLAQIAKLSKVPGETIRRFEDHAPSTITLGELYALGKAVGCALAVRFLPTGRLRRVKDYEKRTFGR